MLRNKGEREMKNYDDLGRLCMSCKEYKLWGMYSLHKKGTNGYKSQCKVCLALDSRLWNNGDLESKPRCRNPHHVMADIHKRLYKERLISIKAAFKNTRFCRKCKETKDVGYFEDMGKGAKHASRYSKYCIRCRDGRTVEEYKIYKECHRNRLRKLAKVDTTLIGMGVASDDHKGFLYILRCDELNCFKVGVTTYDPFSYVASKSKDYGLYMTLVSFISSPIRAYDIERYVTSFIIDNRIEHIKPCGGIARELYDCSLHKLLNILRSITDKMYIKPNPFISVDDIGAKSLTKEDFKGMEIKRRRDKAAEISSFLK
jgi:hypothetical protein